MRSALVLLLCLLTGACSSAPKNPEEALKQLSGRWELQQVDCEGGKLNEDGVRGNQALGDSLLRTIVIKESRHVEHEAAYFDKNRESFCEVAADSLIAIPELGAMELSLSKFSPLKVEGSGAQLQGCALPDPAVYQVKRRHPYSVEGRTLKVKYNQDWLAPEARDWAFCGSGRVVMVYRRTGKS